jgi:hypothetical protein
MREKLSGCPVRLWFFYISSFCLIGIFSVPAIAGKDLFVRKEIEVYAKRDRDSEIIMILEAGDKVPISPKSYGKWRKVLVKVRGKSKVGYVRKKAIRGSKIRTRLKKKKSLPSVYHTSAGAGLTVHLSYLMQSERDYSDSAGEAHIGEMSGMGTFFGLFGDFPMSETMVLRTQLLMRTNSMTGGASAGSGTNEETVELTQSFFSIGGLLKFYSNRDSNFWFGAGAEFAKGRDVSLVYGDNQPVDVPDEGVPNFFVLQGGFGFDTHIAGNFYLLPEIMLTIVANSSPMMYGGEFNIGTAITF